MARVKDISELLHSPLFDAFFVPDPSKAQGKKFKDFMTDPRVIRFFVDVQNKTRLETNLQASGVLPSLNSFEARAMRVVVSNPPCVFDRTKIVEAGKMFCEKYHHKEPKEQKEQKEYWPQTQAETEFVTAIEAECNRACTAASSLLAELIYNSVTTLVVGEKIMIEMPTYFFPAGAGVSPGNGTIFNHGKPDPMATFRFAEPVRIEPQQNFRVEMLFPQGVPGDGVPGNLANTVGPLRIWVVLDGYLTRDVQ
jgi:hypothetical protein